MKILVTGGAGFIGSHLVDAYLKQNHQVIVFDNLSSGRKSNLNPRAKFYQVDIRSDQAAAIFAREKPQILNHHAAQIRIDIAAQDPIFDLNVNTVGLLKLMETARNGAFLKKVVFASTGGAMYGHKQTPFTEKMIPQPLSPYGISKRASELYLNFYSQQYGVAYVALRYANVYGPRQNPEGEAGVIAIFFQHLLTGKQPLINGDGAQTRDYVFISDVVAANLLVTANTVQGEYNIGTTTETDVNRIYDLVAASLDSRIQARHGPPRSAEQLTSSLDSALANSTFSWQPAIDLQQGIALTAAFFRDSYRQ